MEIFALSPTPNPFPPCFSFNLLVKLKVAIHEVCQRVQMYVCILYVC